MDRKQRMLEKIERLKQSQLQSLLEGNIFTMGKIWWAPYNLLEGNIFTMGKIWWAPYNLLEGNIFTMGKIWWAPYNLLEDNIFTMGKIWWAPYNLLEGNCEIFTVRDWTKYHCNILYSFWKVKGIIRKILYFKSSFSQYNSLTAT